ncbi:MAG: HlyC/CorC family transporter [Calditrichaeota bacterium]|nr:HlyC/CorC family transporter [Calditrichota bacterium]
MTLLLFYLFLALGVSFLCSLLEAVILSVTPSFVETLEQKSHRMGATLRHLKTNIERPLAAILSLNTIAHTVGAAGVGAQALVVFGSGYVAVTSAVLTFLILVFSEIIPKTLGALYWQKLATFTAPVLLVMVWLFYPLVLMSQKIASWLSSEKHTANVSREELRAMAVLAKKEGVFSEQEYRLLKNLLGVRKLKVKDIMTPHTVMFTLPADMTVGEVLKKYPEIKFSRIPIYEKTPEDIHAYVMHKDIMREASRERYDTPLRALGRKLKVVPEVVPLLYVFEQFLNQREHIKLVIDEYGSIAGIVTMEDVVETLLGIEIVDETDVTEDMQVLARQLWTKRAKALGLIPEDKSKPPEKS